MGAIPQVLGWHSRLGSDRHDQLQLRKARCATQSGQTAVVAGQTTQNATQKAYSSLRHWKSDLGQDVGLELAGLSCCPLGGGGRRFHQWRVGKVRYW